MNSRNRRYKVTINKETYVVISDKTDEHIKTASELVNEQFVQLKSLSEDMSDKDVAILLALNTVSKQIDLEQTILKMKKRVRQLETDMLYLKQPDKLLVQGNVSTEEVTEHVDVAGVEQTTLFGLIDDVDTPAIYKKK